MEDKIQTENQEKKSNVKKKVKKIQKQIEKPEVNEVEPEDLKTRPKSRTIANQKIEVFTKAQSSTSDKRQESKPLGVIGNDRFKNLLSKFEKKTDAKTETDKNENAPTNNVPKKLDTSKFAFSQNQNNNNNTNDQKEEEKKVFSNVIKSRIDNYLEVAKTRSLLTTASSKPLDPVLEAVKERKQNQAEDEEEYEEVEEEENLNIEEDNEIKNEEN